jgi:hypothetical protein
MRREPEWWKRARKLMGHMKSARSVAKALGKAHTSVLYALDPEFRLQRLKRLRARRECPKYRAAEAEQSKLYRVYKAKK